MMSEGKEAFTYQKLIITMSFSLIGEWTEYRTRWPIVSGLGFFLLLLFFHSTRINLPHLHQAKLAAMALYLPQL